MRQPDMQGRRGDHVRDPHQRAGADHRQNPQRRDGDVGQRLKPRPLERDANRFPKALFDQRRPLRGRSRCAVNHHRHQHEPQHALDHVPIGRGQAVGLRAAAKRQPKGKPHREKELRHDRVGIAEEVVRVLQQNVRRRERADEVDQEHAGHGVAAKLVERRDAGGDQFGGRFGRGLNDRLDGGHGTSLLWGKMAGEVPSE